MAMKLKRLIATVILLANTALTLAAKKNLIIDTDLFSDVDDAGALLLAATAPNINLLAVNINTPSRYSALAASAILAHYGKAHVSIGIRRPLTSATFFDGWYFELGEYASKVAYHFSGGSLPWGRADDAWDPVKLYRKVLAEAEDGSVTVASIGFLDNLSALLTSPPDTYSPLPGHQLLTTKLSELVVMGGSYPSGPPSWNFFGSNTTATIHVINTWRDHDPDTMPRMVFLGDEVGQHVLTGKPLMDKSPENDPVRRAYVWYGYGAPRPAWDPLAVWYAIYGLGEMFEYGNEFGYNLVEEDGSNRWVWDEGVRNQFFLRLKVSDKRAAEEVDRLMLEGALSVGREKGEGRGEQGRCLECGNLKDEL